MSENAKDAHFGAFALIRNEQGKVLVVENPDNTQYLLGLPGGAATYTPSEGTELSHKTVVRKVHEETSLKVEPIRLIGRFHHKLVYGTVDLFECAIISGTPTPQPPKTLACQFYSWEDLYTIRERVWRAQLSMIYQVLFTEPNVGDLIFNHFIPVP